MEYFFHVMFLIGIYIGLSVSLDLLVGSTGLLSLAHAGFYGLGAYASALLSIHFGTPFPLGVLVGICLATVVSVLVSPLVTHLSDEYFAIGTLGLQMILFGIYHNWSNVTGGSLGLRGIPRPVIPGFAEQTHLDFTILSLTFAFFAFCVVRRVSGSPFGRVLRAIREDEIFAQSLGKNTSKVKIRVFAISAGLAAMAGGLYAHYVTYIDPTSFTIMESILVVSMVIIGGAGSRWGPVVGALVLATLPEFLRFIGMSGSAAANIRQILYGGLLVAFMMWRPCGFLGEYAFQKGESKE